MVVFSLQRKLYFSKDPEGVQHFPGGSNFFHGGGRGVQMLISIETHITNIPGGGRSRPPIPPSGSAHALYQSWHVIHIGNT